MKSHDLSIIHLSDLHFSNGVQRSVCEKLIRDLGEQVKNDRDIILVITGDFITGNDFEHNKANVVSFFKSIREVLPKSVRLLDVELVPGNHDGSRAVDSPDYNGKTYLSKLDSYKELESAIYKIFSIEPRNIPGTTVVDFYDRKLELCRLDTASFETHSKLVKQVADKTDDDDTARACVEVIEKKFCEHFENQLKQCAAEHQRHIAENNHRDLDLTIVLSHHPLSILRFPKYETVDDVLFQNNFSVGDILISGHVHSAGKKFASYNTHQSISLTTGLGWQDNPNDFLRYSIYRINLDRKTCQIIVRSSVRNEDFRQDETSGQNDEFMLYKHMTLPLKLNSVGAAIHAKSFCDGHRRGIYADVTVIEAIPKMLSALQDARKKLEFKVLNYELIAKAKMREEKYSGLFNAIRNWNKDKKALLETCINEIVKRDNFLEEVVKEICSELGAMLRKLTEENELEDNAGDISTPSRIEWRVHARRYKGMKCNKIKKKTDLYVSNFAFDVYGESHKQVPSDMEWDSLIKAAFNSKHKVLVNSANPQISKQQTEWSDFLTCVPFTHKPSKFIKVFSVRESRPLLSFGISFKVNDHDGMCKATQLLYLLEYLQLGNLIEEVLELFITRYNFSTTDIIKGLT